MGLEGYKELGLDPESGGKRRRFLAGEEQGAMCFSVLHPAAGWRVGWWGRRGPAELD